MSAGACEKQKLCMLQRASGMSYNESWLKRYFSGHETAALCQAFPWSDRLIVLAEKTPWSPDEVEEAKGYAEELTRLP